MIDRASFLRLGAASAIGLLASDSQDLAWLRGLRGDPIVSTLPNPVDLETAGDQLDTLLQATGYPS